jgi:preprotein translocase subunit YajC
MSVITIICMLIIPGIVWGGLIYFLILSIHKEKRKNYHG